MFARLAIYENVDLDLADRVSSSWRAWRPIPSASCPGYRGSMTLVDRDNARLVGHRLLRERRPGPGSRRAAHGDAGQLRRPGPRGDPPGARHAG
jgi:hypothetical protein